MTNNPKRRSSGSSRSNLAALIVIVLIVGALLWVAQAIVSHNQLQNCMDSGRHDCLPLPGQ